MNYETRTVTDQKAALTAVGRLAAAFPDLPAPEWNVSRIYPEQVRLSFHDDLADFEAWRIALGIEISGISYATQPGSTILAAQVKWSDCLVDLTGYGPLPLHDVERGEQA